MGSALAWIEESLAVHQALASSEAAAWCEGVAERLVTCLQAGGTVFFVGNGGSAADAQHLAAELVGRFYYERPPLRAIALTVNTSALTAIANDYPAERLFARQLEALARPGDVLVAISTSGNSPNILACVDTADAIGVSVVGLTGAHGGLLAPRCATAFRVPSPSTPRIQEGHILLGHVVCALVEARLHPAG